MAREMKAFVQNAGKNPDELQREIILEEIARNSVIMNKLASPMAAKDAAVDLEALKLLSTYQKETRQLMEELRRLGGSPADEGGEWSAD